MCNAKKITNDRTQKNALYKALVLAAKPLGRDFGNVGLVIGWNSIHLLIAFLTISTHTECMI